MSFAAAEIAQRVFREVHTDLPREAPGSRSCTIRALTFATTLPATPDVLDIGCGPGTQTLDLARQLPGARITAVDAHEPFVSVARRRLQAAGLEHRVAVEVGDMRRLRFAAASFDLLWCEGAVYIMGVAAALAAWRRLLRPGGYIGFTDAVWLSDAPPEALRQWWTGAYPSMGDVDTCLGCVQGCGFEVAGHFVLPEAAWWDDYYGPMEERLAMLRERYRTDPASVAALAAHQREVDHYRRWSQHYGYLFVVGRWSGEG